MAQAVAYVGNLFGIPARALILDTAPKSKIDAVRKYGAEVVIISWDDAIAYSENPPGDRCFIHPLGEFKLMDGHGTIGLEIMEDEPDIDTVFVPLGAGFLGASISLAVKAIKPSVKVIGVNAENSPHFYKSLEAGKVVETKPKATLADGISALATESTLNLIKETLDEVVLVSERKIEKAIRFLAIENKVVAEGAGAISLAAALDVPLSKRGKSACIISGGSIDPEKLVQILREK
jgi:threonine dehydratase